MRASRPASGEKISPALHPLRQASLVAAQARGRRRRIAITAFLEDDTTPHAIHDDTRDHLPGVVPTLDERTDLGDPCLRG